MANRKGIRILNGRATIYEPTTAQSHWRIVYIDEQGQRRQSTRGRSREDATASAALLIGTNESRTRKGAEPDTVEDCFTRFIEDNRARWNTRTVANYESVAERYLLRQFGNRYINTITITELRHISTGTLSTGQQRRLRYIVRETFQQGAGWLDAEPDTYAKAIRITGTKESQPTQDVSRGDVPTDELVAAFITTAYSTFNITPLDTYEGNEPYIDIATGQKHHTKTRTEYDIEGLNPSTPIGHWFRDGLPADTTKRLIGRYPKRYDAKKYLTKRTAELGTVFRRIAVIMGLGAGAGLRIGEALALRPRHLMNIGDVLTAALCDWDITNKKVVYRGIIHVCEQVSQTAHGKLWLSAPKMNSTRDAVLPAFLPSWHGYGIGTYRSDITKVIPRFSDESTSLWTATTEECLELWKAGFTPVGWMLWQLLKEMWNESPVLQPYGNDVVGKAKAFMNLLMFPTMNHVRDTPTGTPFTQHADGWQYDATILSGDGGYQSQSNFANRYSNPIYDYVAGLYDIYPLHRVNNATRKGWTHHGLRHYAVASRIKLGVPLPTIARQMGHKNPAFTLQRYGNFLDNEDNKTLGFEY